MLVLSNVRKSVVDTVTKKYPNLSVDEKIVAPLVERRIRERIPAAYLLNEAWLDGRVFYVDRRVIVPRSHIAFLLKGKLAPWLRRSPRRVLDLCTGSGCLAILAALALPRARVCASDISAAALAVAKRNVAKYGLQGRVKLVRSDLFESVAQCFDLILANPPYVPSASMRELPPEYRYEPGMALAGGRNGLEFVARILADAPQRLEKGGLLICEVGEARRALERASTLPFTWVGESVFVLQRKDLAA